MEKGRDMSLHRKIQRIHGAVEKVQGKLKEAQKMRLILGLNIFLLLIFSQILKGYSLELFGLFGLSPFFIYYYKRSRKIKSFLNSLQNLSYFYQSQENFQKGLFTKEVLAEDMYDSSLARDLDLGLLFSNINYCFSKQGGALLSQWLCQEFKSSSLSERKQNLVELTKSPGLIRKLQMRTCKVLVDFARIEKEISRSFFPEPIAWKWILPISWLALICFLLTPVPAIVWKATLLIYVGSMLFYIGKTKHLFSQLQDLHTDFSNLKEQTAILERLSSNVSFASALKKHQASQDVKKISRLISLMSVKTNPILFYVLNLIVPWDFFLAELCERSRRDFYEHFKIWSLEVIQIEALACLANLKFYHNTNWATESSEPFLSVTDIAHPLLNQDLLVANSFDPLDYKIFIITGSNMSGKSTFLRSIGINFCLANIGAPVFASEFLFKPMPIVSCIRVSDSLRDGQSYFYAEVQQMKGILNRAKREEILFLIDEPLRGTNNRERLIGNKSYLQQILALNAQGFISTHDLELTQLANEGPQIANHHFSDQWDNDVLKFDYKIKDGPSQSTNALKILAREGLYQETSNT